MFWRDHVTRLKPTTNVPRHSCIVVASGVCKARAKSADEPEGAGAGVDAGRPTRQGSRWLGGDAWRSGMRLSALRAKSEQTNLRVPKIAS